MEEWNGKEESSTRTKNEIPDLFSVGNLGNSGMGGAKGIDLGSKTERTVRGGGHVSLREVET